MMGSWWLLWMVFMLVFLVPSLGYGWGYRRWGPPYPRYIQRRRGQQAAAMGGSTTFNHQSWGLGGDFVWVVMLIGVFWACTAFWWR
jgi:hypothetical protein